MRRDANANKISAAVFLSSLAVLLALAVLSSILALGDRLSAAHPVFGIVFYLVLCLVAVLGIIVPVFRVASRPVFSLYRLRDERGRSRVLWCRRLRNNLLHNASLTQEELDELQRCPAMREGEAEELIGFFEAHIVPRIEEQTKRSARFAFGATAVSQSSLVDAVTMLSVSFDLIRSIVEACGFRPSNLVVMRLYLRVMASALVAGGIEEMDLDTLLAGMVGGGTSARVSGLVVASAAQGFVNAFLVFRIGCITRRYLCAVDGPISMKEAKKGSYAEALSKMKSSGFMKDAATFVKERAAAAANSVSQSVKTAAQDMGTAARETALAAAVSLERSMKRSPLGRLFGKKGS